MICQHGTEETSRAGDQESHRGLFAAAQKICPEISRYDLNGILPLHVDYSIGM
jgi:hypothetical protein